MPKHILGNYTEDLRREFEDLQDWFFMRYHYYPSANTSRPVSAQEASDLATYTEMANRLAAQHNTGGKKITYSKSDTCNGLPRRK